MIPKFLHAHDNTARCKTHKRSNVSMFSVSKATCSDETIPYTHIHKVVLNYRNSAFEDNLKMVASNVSFRTYLGIHFIMLQV